jgi:manganese transport protein
MKNNSRSLDDVHSSVDTTNKVGNFKKFFAFFGPAYLVSVGYMDPGNWATDIAAGSGFGYELIWVLLMSNLMALLLQSHCARLGVVYGKDLAQSSRLTYPSFINIPLYVLAEIAIAACDLAEVLGLAIGLQLLLGIPIMYGVLIAVLDSILLLAILHFGIRKMEAFIISMVFIIGISFFIEMILSKPDIGGIVNGFVPSALNGNALYIAIGIIGATVMPHNLYLHSALVQTRKFDKSESGIRKALKFNFIDTGIALNLALFVNAGILILAAAVFHKNGMFEIAEIQDAHQLLGPMLGTSLAPTLFAIALIASGQSSTITGTLAGQIIMEGYINIRISPWLRRLLTRLLAVIPAFIVVYFLGEDKTGELLILSQVILSMQLGFAVIPLIHFVSDVKKMKGFVINRFLKTISWITASIIIILNVKLVYESIIQLFITFKEYKYIISPILFPLIAYLVYVLVYITIKPFFNDEKIDSEINLDNIRISHPENFSRIALTVDFSKFDSRTISQALAIGKKDAKYLLIHVVESANAFIFGEETDDEEVYEDMKKLKLYCSSLTEKGFDVNVELGFGKRTVAIKKITEKFNADLLVMGTHGHSGIKDLIFGETINAIRHNISIPLLAVK